MRGIYELQTERSSCEPGFIGPATFEFNLSQTGDSLARFRSTLWSLDYAAAAATKVRKKSIFREKRRRVRFSRPLARQLLIRCKVLPPGVAASFPGQQIQPQSQSVNPTDGHFFGGSWRRDRIVAPMHAN